MVDQILAFLFFLKTDIWNFINLNFREISFSDLRGSLNIGLILIAILVLKILFLWFKSGKISQKYSGIKIRGYYFRGLIVNFLILIPKLLFGLAVGILLLGLAEPFFSRISEDKKLIESRTRVDLRDESSSMGEFFPGSMKSKAQVAAESHLEFLKMRQGKFDRTSLWLFASNAYLLEDFIVDDQLYFDQVYDAPWLVGQNTNFNDQQDENSSYLPNFPKERYQYVYGEGSGTDMAGALTSVIRQLNNDAKRLASIGVNISKLKRSVLIITDAEVDQPPSNELAQLHKMDVRPYVILIKTNQKVIPEFAQTIRNYGGEYFDVTNENSLKRAYQAIDKLEASKIEIVKKSYKLPIFRDFIFIGIVLMALAILVLLVIEPFGTYP